MSRFLLSALLLILFGHGCASPPHRELETARAALAEARSLGADELAPARYRTAREVLENSEAFMAEGQYRQARETLPYAEGLARQATKAARIEWKRRDTEDRRIQGQLQGLKERLREEAEGRQMPPVPVSKPAHPEPSKSKVKPTTKEKASTGSEATGKSSAQPDLPSSYTVIAGETLWVIAGKKEIYQDPLLWPLLYRANRDQIKDPRRVYGGQTLMIPRNQSPSELAETRNSARASDIFPLDLLMKNPPTPTP